MNQTNHNPLPANTRYANPDEQCWLCGRNFGGPNGEPEIVHRYGVCWNTAACHEAQKRACPELVEGAVPLSAESVMARGIKRTVHIDDVWTATYRRHNKAKYGRRRYRRSDRHNRTRRAGQGVRA